LYNKTKDDDGIPSDLSKLEYNPFYLDVDGYTLVIIKMKRLVATTSEKNTLPDTNRTIC